MRIFQEFLLWVYRVFKKTGLFEAEWFQYFFSSAYFSYKRYFEDPFAGLTKKYPELFRGGHILDVGANVGYTSVVFSKAIAPGFQVYSFEPEQDNFVVLKKTIATHKASQRIIPVQAAMGETSGEIALWYNENHHADHRILTDEYKDSGVALSRVTQVPMWSIDRFVELEIDSTPIKFIKIDVQGYELPVCLGMQQTLTNYPDVAIAVEYSPDSMTELGFQPQDLLSFFQERGYCMYFITHRGKLELISHSSKHYNNHKNYTRKSSGSQIDNPTDNQSSDQSATINQSLTVGQTAKVGQILKERGYIDLLFVHTELL